MKSKQQDGTHSVEPCDICGGVGWPELIVTCSKCNVAHEHIYCMPIFVRGIRDDWICKTCHDENDTISLNMNISRDPVFDSSNDITELEITPSTSEVQKTSVTKEDASHSLAKGGSTSGENSTEFVLEHDGNMDLLRENDDVPMNIARERFVESVTRGRTVMARLIKLRSKGIRLELEWNEKGNPIGPNSSSFNNFIGTTVRDKVPITIQDWRRVKKQYGDKIWGEVQSCFIIYGDDQKNFVLRKAGKLMRLFRSNLVKFFVRDDNENIIPTPPNLYEGIITQEIWDEFLKTHTTPEFQELSEKNRSNASNMTYRYIKGPVSYGQLEKKIIEKSNSDITQVPRHDLWVAGCTNKQGEIRSEEAKRIAEYCQSMTQEVPELATYVGRNDLLSRALGVPEYDGRVRGTGFAVTQTSYFGRQKRYRGSDFWQLQEEMNSFKHQMQQFRERMQEQTHFMEEQMRLMEEENAQLRTQINHLVQCRATHNVPTCDN